VNGLAAVRAALVRCRIDARRPASWLGLAAAACIAGLVGRLPPAWWPALPIVAGAFAAAAAIGGPPRDVPGLASAWVATRAGWPLAGVAVACATGRTDPATAAVIVVAAVATAAAVALAVERSAPPGAAASVPLVAACAAAAAAGFVRATWPAAVGGAPFAAATAWAAVAGCTAWVVRPLGSDASGDVAPAAGFFFGGAIGRLWLHAAMLSALAGMVAWLLLMPQAAWCYALLAAAWFTAAAVPLATLGPGSVGDAGRRRLAATVPHQAARWLSAVTGPSAGATALVTAATFAAILGWPPLVAALIVGAGATRTWNLLSAAALGCGAVSTAAISTVVAAAGGTRDTAHAVALAIALAAVAAAAVQPSRGAQESPATPGRTDVERSGGSCNTPPRSPRHGGPVSCPDFPAFVRTVLSPSGSAGS
jgi:hypothetical protein